MRKTSGRELHIRTSELVREAEEGGIIVIERRGEPVAELRRCAGFGQRCRRSETAGAFSMKIEIGSRVFRHSLHAKFYLNEPESAPALRSSVWALPEFHAVLHRHCREGSLTHERQHLYAQTK